VVPQAQSEGIHDANINDRLLNTYSGGPRRLGATKVVMKLRRLRAAHPKLADDHPVPDPSASDDSSAPSGEDGRSRRGFPESFPLTL
jgi:hypothetical protein